MHATSHAAHDSYVLFELRGTTYALASDVVTQMDMIDEITAVPNAAPYIDGVVLCGAVVPAMNLRNRFGFDRIPYDPRTRLIIVAVGGRAVGLIVDSAREFVVIPAASIQPPPECLAGAGDRYLAGIAMLGQRMVLVLNVADLLRTD